MQDYGQCTCKGTAPRLRARVLAAGTMPVTVISTAPSRTEWHLETTAGPCALNFAESLRSVPGMQHKSASSVSGILLVSTADRVPGMEVISTADSSIQAPTVWRSGVRQWEVGVWLNAPPCAVFPSVVELRKRSFGTLIRRPVGVSSHAVSTLEHCAVTSRVQFAHGLRQRAVTAVLLATDRPPFGDCYARSS